MQSQCKALPSFDVSTWLARHGLAAHQTVTAPDGSMYVRFSRRELRTAITEAVQDAVKQHPITVLV